MNDIENRTTIINNVPYFFLNNYERELEIDWKRHTIKSYSVKEERHKLYKDKGSEDYYYVNENGAKIYPEEEEIQKDVNENLYVLEETSTLEKESRFIKANKYFIMILKYLPLVAVFLLSFKIPINFSSLLMFASGEQGVTIHHVFGFSKILSYFVAGFFLFLVMKLRDRLSLLIGIFVAFYLLFFILSTQSIWFASFNKNLLVSLCFVWSIKLMYEIYIDDDFENYYKLIDITRNKVFYRKRLLGKIGIGDKYSILKRFKISGYYMRVLP